jgi:hypothetical protein
MTKRQMYGRANLDLLRGRQPVIADNGARNRPTRRDTPW